MDLLNPAGRFADPLRRLADRVARDEQAVLAPALVLEREIKQELSKRGSGRTYKRGKKVHQASAPGEPPAVDSGRLRSSVGHEQTDEGVRVGTAVTYAIPLEYGSSRMKPRPFIRPALERAKAEMGEEIQAELKDAAIELRHR
jgi:HK97 gp10 family phage protein